MIKSRFLIATVCAAMLGVFSLQAQAAAPKVSPDTYKLLNLFGDVFERVRKDYVEEVEDKKLIESAINGMLTSLDPHSSYLSADNYKDMQVQTSGQFGGLGIEVTMESGWVKVVSPIDDTPASRAGIKPGDYITHLEGEQVLGLTLTEAVDKMRGPVDTQLTLTIRREGKPPFDVTLTRAVIKIRSVRYHLIGDDVGYIRVTSFNDQTDIGVRRGVEEMSKESGDKLVGYVIDMRNNPGGLLDQAISVSDMFLDHGEIVSTRSRIEEDTQRHNAKKGDLANGLPIVVLINDGSASASEIVAGALQDHRRAILMGTKTFGKGSVQTIIPMYGQGAMRLTTARYYTPSGRSIQAKGIEPDIEVRPAHVELLKTWGERSEAEFINALDRDKDSKEDKKSDESVSDMEDTEKGEKDEDYQLDRAVDLLRGLNLYVFGTRNDDDSKDKKDSEVSKKAAE